MVRQQQGHGACKRLAVGLLVVTNNLALCMSAAPVDATTSIILDSDKVQKETFWYRLAGVVLANGR